MSPLMRELCCPSDHKAIAGMVITEQSRFLLERYDDKVREFNREVVPLQQNGELELARRLAEEFEQLKREYLAKMKVLRELAGFYP